MKTLSFFRIALPWSRCSSCRQHENPKDRRMPGFRMKRCNAPSFDPTELKFSAVRWREACRFCPSTIRSNDARAGDLGSGGASSPLPLFLPADVHPAARGEGMTSDRNLCCFYKKRGSSCRTLGSLEVLCRWIVDPIQDYPECGDLPHFQQPVVTGSFGTSPSKGRSRCFVVGGHMSLWIERDRRRAMLDPIDEDIDPDQPIDRQASIFENPNCSALH